MANLGMHHPTYNPNGARRASDNLPWYSTTITFNSTSDCFDTTKLDMSSGIIGGASGSDNQYKFADAIYSGLVEDLRLSSHVQDTNKLLVDAIRKSVAGTMRGKGKVPFTKVVNTTRFAAGWNAGQGSYYYTVGHPLEVGDKSKLIGDDGTVYDGVITLANTETLFYVDLSYGDVRANLTGNLTVVNTWDLSAEYDSLPYVNIIGDIARIAATFPNGCVGEWISVIPDGSSRIPLSEKAIASTTPFINTQDDGANWVNSAVSLDNVTNTKSPSAADLVGLLIYESLSNFTEAANNSVVLGDVGNVFCSNSNNIALGNRLNPSLSGGIGKTSSSKSTFNSNGVFNHRFGFLPAQYGRLDVDVNYQPMHEHMNLPSPDNLSVGTKSLYTITEKDGFLYAQFHGCGLEWGTPTFTDVTSGAYTSWALNDFYRVRVGRFTGNFKCVRATSLAADWDGWSVESNGDIVAIDNGLTYFTKLPTNGSGWGDDSTIPIIDQEGTKTDLNGNTVKTFCHHLQIPLGIASATSSSQSS